LGLIYRVPRPVLAKRYGVSVDALYRHDKHLSPAQRAALMVAQKPTDIDLEALQRAESEGLIGQLVGQRARLQQLAEMALEAGDVKSAIAVERAVVANLELVGRLVGQLVVRHEVRNVLISADYIAVRSAILAALAPYPEAKLAVGRAAGRAGQSNASADQGSARPRLTAPSQARH
jgi:hypothetical protein